MLHNEATVLHLSKTHPQAFLLDGDTLSIFFKNIMEVLFYLKNFFKRSLVK